MSDRWNAALEAAADRLRTRACGYLARGDTIYNGRIVSEELFGLAESILALREAEDQRGAAATCTEGASSETGESQNRASDGKLEAQSAPHPDMVLEQLRDLIRRALPSINKAFAATPDQASGERFEIYKALAKACDGKLKRVAAQAQVQEDVESLETAGQPVSATHLPASGPYKARQSTQNNHVAPDYVDGPNGFSALSYGAWELAEHLNRLLAAAEEARRG